MNNRTLTCPLPENLNPLSPNGYMFSVQRLPSMTYFCQEVNLPSISIGEATQMTPFTHVPIAGDTLEFGQLNVQFLIDEKMENYKAIHNWLVGLGFPENNQQYTTMLNGAANTNGAEVTRAYSDATLTILGNHNTPIQTVQFIDLYPESIDSITFLSTSQDVQYLVGNVTFKYAYYRFI